MLRIVEHTATEFATTLRALEHRGEADLSAVEPAVRAILEDVRARGDAAVLDACERFERRRPAPLLKTFDGAAALARLAPAARTVGRFSNLTPPMQKTGRWTRACTSRISPRPTGT